MKKLIVLCVSLMMVLGVVSVTDVSAKQSYSTIYRTYKKKLTSKGKKCVKSYKRRARGTKNINKMATIANDEVTKLASVLTNGGTKMASYMYASDMNYNKYKNWYAKLYKVYNKQAFKVYDAYNAQYVNSQKYLSKSQKKNILRQLRNSERTTLKEFKPA